MYGEREIAVPEVGEKQRLREREVNWLGISDDWG